MLAIQLLTAAACLCSPFAAALSSDVDDDPLTQPRQGTVGTCTASSGNSYHPHTKPMEDPRISRLLGKQRRAEREAKTESSIVQPLNGTRVQCFTLISTLRFSSCSTLLIRVAALNVQRGLFALWYE